MKTTKQLDRRSFLKMSALAGGSVMIGVYTKSELLAQGGRGGPAPATPVNPATYITVHPDNIACLPKRVDGVSISRIGEITAQPNTIKIAEGNHIWDLPPQGFEHFKRTV